MVGVKKKEGDKSNRESCLYYLYLSLYSYPCPYPYHHLMSIEASKPQEIYQVITLQFLNTHHEPDTVGSRLHFWPQVTIISKFQVHPPTQIRKQKHKVLLGYSLVTDRVRFELRHFDSRDHRFHHYSSQTLLVLILFHEISAGAAHEGEKVMWCEKGLWFSSPWLFWFLRVCNPIFFHQFTHMGNTFSGKFHKSNSLKI